MTGPTSPLGEISPETRAALRRLITSLADTKRILGIRYSDWLLGAPSIEAGIAASSMAQDEWGHARLLYAMLKDFDVDPVEIEHERPAEQYCCAGCLDEPFPDWACFTAGVVVVDGLLAAALEGFGRGSYETARSRIPKMLAEEEFHRDLGAAWFRRLSSASEEARGLLVESVSRMLGPALAAIAPDDDGARLLAEQGLAEPADRIRARFEAHATPLLAAIGIDLAGYEADVEGWDPIRGRGPGQPDEDAVTRARGDLNRALFVE